MVRAGYQPLFPISRLRGHAHRRPGTQVLIGRFFELGSRLGSITPTMEELSAVKQAQLINLVLCSSAAGIFTSEKIPIPSEMT